MSFLGSSTFLGGARGYLSEDIPLRKRASLALPNQKVADRFSESRTDQDSAIASTHAQSISEF